jgi:hypothetical protein
MDSRSMKTAISRKLFRLSNCVDIAQYLVANVGWKGYPIPQYPKPLGG